MTNQRGLTAVGALVGPLAGVDTVMPDHIALVGEGPLAYVTLVWSFTCEASRLQDGNIVRAQSPRVNVEISAAPTLLPKKMRAVF